MRLRVYLAVAAGSGLGAGLRCLISVLMPGLPGPAVIWDGLLVNVLGSWLIGFYVALMANGAWRPGPAMQQFVITGFCGGFTSFSIFSLGALSLFLSGKPGWAGIYVIGSLCLWMLSVAAGFIMGSRVARHRA